jgi:hypothetical protein
MYSCKTLIFLLSKQQLMPHGQRQLLHGGISVSATVNILICHSQCNILFLITFSVIGQTRMLMAKPQMWQKESRRP